MKYVKKLRKKLYALKETENVSFVHDIMECYAVEVDFPLIYAASQMK